MNFHIIKQMLMSDKDYPGKGKESPEADDHFLGVVNFQDQVHLTEPAHKLLQLHSQRSVSEEEEQTAGHQGADSQ